MSESKKMYLFLINMHGKAQFEIIVIGNIVCGLVTAYQILHAGSSK